MTAPRLIALALILATFALAYTLRPQPATNEAQHVRVVSPRELDEWLQTFPTLPANFSPSNIAKASERPARARSWTWDETADCESGGDWAQHTSLYEGGLDFVPSTWSAYRDASMPAHAYDATREQQIVVAERVLAAQGPKAWPVCSYKVGMR